MAGFGDGAYGAGVYGVAPFPQGPLVTAVEIYYSGAWQDITSQVYARDSIQITRGRANEASAVEASRCQLTLNNRNGQFSLRNPTGALYGLIQRNTPLRVSVVGSSYLQINGPTTLTAAGGAYVVAQSKTQLNFPSDLDVRFDADLTSWREAMPLVAKWDGTSGCSFELFLGSNGTITFYRSTDGTTGSAGGHQFTTTLPQVTGRMAVRVTWDQDNGAGGSVWTLLTAPTAAGPWVTYETYTSPTVGGNTFATNTQLEILDSPVINSTGASVIRGKVYSASVMNGIGGTLVANPDFTVLADQQQTFTDSVGLQWAVVGAVAVSTKDIRFTGEIPQWPQKWDTTGTDAWSSIEGAGALRRLGQGSSALQSPVYRGIAKQTTPPAAYWPMEDGTSATFLASATINGLPMQFGGATPNLSTNTGIAGSMPLPELNGASLTGNIPAYANTGTVCFRGFVSIPAAGSTGDVIFRFFTKGTAYRWDVIYTTGGSLTLASWDTDGNLLQTSGAIGFLINGVPQRIDVELVNSGANVNWLIGTLASTPGATGLISSGTLTGKQVSSVTRVQVNPKKNLDATVAVGHITVENSIPSFFNLYAQAVGFFGETAGRRIQRLCREEAVNLEWKGALDFTVQMGVQQPEPLLTLLQECVDADMGILYEPRDQYGLGFIPHSTLYNLPVTLALDYSLSQMNSLDPVDDDQLLRNDVTVTRLNGSSARSVVTVGPLSNQAPPNGVGTYDDGVTVQVAYDSQLGDQAGWRTHVGTIDQSRYPSLALQLAAPEFANNAALTAQAVALDLGGRWSVVHPPSQLPPETVQQLLQGMTEQMSQFDRTLTLNSSPETPWEVGVYGISTPVTSRYSSADSTVGVALNTTATALSVAFVDRRWTTDIAGQGQFDLMIAGERMTVTAITGTTSPQAFTVVRSVNGVVKSHIAGESIALFTPAVYGY